MVLVVAGVLNATWMLLNLGRPPQDMGLLSSAPEAELLYPGSEVIAEGGSDAEFTILGHRSAFAWQYVGVDATPEEILAWYTAELTSRGWVEGGGSSGIPSVEELVVRAWEKDTLIFRLGVQDPGYWGADPEVFSRYESIYDVRLISND